jgi:signal transduction histidine kinase
MSEVISRSAVPDRQALDKIAGTSRELMQSMSEIVWAIDPSHDRLRDLVQRMRWFAGETLSYCGVALSFSAPEEDCELRLSVETRRQIFVIFKECVNNIARHSGARSASIEMRLEQHHLVLTVEDDGCGIDSCPRTGHGLRNMEQRARMLSADFDITNRPGGGTHIVLRVPFGQRGRGGRQPAGQLRTWHSA